MDARAEKYIEKAKAGLSDVGRSLQASPAHWMNCASAVRTCMSYVDQSGLMNYPNRMEERVWIIKKVQGFAYYDSDSDGIPDIGLWCEREWNRILQTDPYHVGAYTGLGEAWLGKSQYWLARIHRDEGTLNSRELDASADRRVDTSDYLQARTSLQPAADFFARAVQYAQSQGRLAAPLLVKSAEASMSLGNVSSAREGRRYFKDAVRALQAARSMPGYRLPSHLCQYLREHEYILKA